MRCLVAVVVLIGCEGAPAVPAHLEEVADIPQTGSDLPAAFDVDDTLVLMDNSTGLRRLVGDRLRSVSGGESFSFGSIGVDRDGTLLLGSQNTGQLARLEANDVITNIAPQPPSSFNKCTAVPSGAYHILQFGAVNTLTLPLAGAAWVDSLRALDRTLLAPDGTIYAIENGDIVELDSTDAAATVASCAEFAGGTCPNLELAGVDSAGHVHMAIPGLPDLHILDPDSGSYRDIALPGGLEIVTMVSGTQHALVMASDPDRDDERSLWLLEDGSDELVRFTSLGAPFTLGFVRLLADHAGNTHVIASGKLSRVVVD